MSRFIEQLPDGSHKITLDSREQCKHMYNDVCCNDKSPCVADYPQEWECDRCPLFEPEDLEDEPTT